MITSEFDGQAVNYIDAMRIQHQGVVVGQSADRQFILVQSSNPKAGAADWHFKVRRLLLPGVLVTQA